MIDIADHVKVGLAGLVPIRWLIRLIRSNLIMMKSELLMPCCPAPSKYANEEAEGETRGEGVGWRWVELSRDLMIQSERVN